MGDCCCISGCHAGQALVIVQFLDLDMHTSSEKQANAGPTQQMTDNDNNNNNNNKNNIDNNDDDDSNDGNIDDNNTATDKNN